MRRIPSRIREDSRKSNVKSRESRSERGNESWHCDRELVDHILAGSREHFDLLYVTYFPRVYRFALTRLNDRSEAEDVTQDVFLTLISALASFEGRSPLLIWIFGVTRNKVNRRLRRARPRLEPLDEGGALDVWDGEAPIDDAVDARRVLRRCEAVIANDLTPLQRRVFHLRYLQQQSIRRIAHALGKSEDAIKMNLYRMRRSITAATPDLERILRS
jgi:RNA polymerase sigma-70 factor (ECF subfamily)